MQIRCWEILHSEGDKALEQIAQRSHGCPIPEVKSRVRWSPGQPDLVDGDPACCRAIELELYLRSLSTQAFLQFYIILLNETGCEKQSQELLFNLW